LGEYFWPSDAEELSFQVSTSPEFKTSSLTTSCLIQDQNFFKVTYPSARWFEFNIQYNLIN
jgi:hypothetical protein